MIRASELVGGIMILTFMGVVLWQTAHESPAKEEQSISCTMDAKLCSDGSAVGRIGPDCSFAECPGPVEKAVSVICSPEPKMVDVCIDIYQPVCGLVEVQCITTPCNPVPETFSNGCYACLNNNVASYTEGACE